MDPHPSYWMLVYLIAASLAMLLAFAFAIRAAWMKHRRRGEKVVRGFPIEPIDTTPPRSQ